MSERDWNKDWEFIQRLKEAYYQDVHPVISSAKLDYTPYFVDFGEHWLQRVRELETITQAAREFLNTIDLAERTGANITMPPVQWQALYKLREALAALDNDKYRNCGAPLEKCGPELWEKQKKCCPECTHREES